MSSLAEKLEQAAFERQIEVDRLAAKETRDAAVLLAALAVFLVEELRKAAPNERASIGRQWQRVEALTREISPEVTRIYRQLKNRNIALLEGLAQNEGADVVAAVAAAAGASLLTHTITPRRAKALIASLNIEGAPLAQWWSQQRATILREFRRQLRLGLANNEELSTLVARIWGTRAQRQRGGLMGVTRRHVETLVRTAMHGARQEARFAIYAAHPEIITHIQALNEAPVSRICQSRAGRVWRIEEAPARPPWHPNCKTTMIPILRSFASLRRAGLPQRLENELEGLSGAERQALNGKPAATLTPEQIFKRMPRERATKLLGRERMKLFEEGKLNFRQLVDQSGRPRTLEELRELING